MQGIVAITSGKGGVGKSTLAAAAGLFLAKAGKRACLIDMDMGLRSLDIMLGMEDRVVFDLADVAEGMCRVKQALVKHQDYPGLCLISAAQTRGSEAVGAMQARRVVQQLADRFDWVIVDCPAGVGRGFRAALSVAQQAVVVSTPGPVELRDAERVAALIRHMDLPDPMLVLNRVRPQHMDQEEWGLPAYLKRLEGSRLTGLIPEALGPLAQDRRVAAALELAVRNMTGEDIPPLPVARPSLLARLSQALRA